MNRLPCTLLAGLLAAAAAAVLLVPPAGAGEPAGDYGAAPYLEKLWAQPTVREKQTQNWLNQAAGLLENRGQVALPDFYPTGAKGRVLYRSTWGVHAVNLETGKLDWEADSRWSLDQMVREPGKSGALSQWVNAEMGGAHPGVVFENSVLGNLTTDGKMVFAVEDLAVAPPVVQNFQFPGQPPQPFNPTYAPAVNDAVFHSRLQAYDLETGKLAWELGSRNKKDDLADTYFLAAPLVHEGKLYVLSEKEGNLALLTIDPARGKVEQSTHLASFRTRLSQDPYRRLSAAPVVASDGVMVCPTNAGVLIGVDMVTNTILWVHSYTLGERPTPPPQDPNNPQQVPQPGFGRFYQAFSWKATAPIVHDGKVLYTAPDGQSVVCVGLHDGEMAWRTPAAQDDLYLAGAFKDKVVLVGKRQCRALNLKNGKAAWAVETGTPSGRGVAADGVYFLPLKVAAGTREPAVWGIDMDKGEVVARTKSRGKDVPGNLALFDGHVISQTVNEVVVYPQISTKLSHIDSLIKKDPKDPDGLTERGELRLAKGDLQGAVDDLHAALDNKPHPETRARARDRLYRALTEYVQRDFDKAEKYLDEYEQLCKVEIPAGASDPEKQDLEKETRRRQAEFLFLKGRGREKGGKLAEALRCYLDFLALASNEELVVVTDDPAVRARRDLWAGARVTALVAAANADERKELENLIARKWQAIRDGNDLEAVRNFVRVFGNSAVGRDARLWLAERLAADKLFLEAELNLEALRRQTDDPPRAGQAVEALARLYADKGLVEDAAHCYRVLGSDYAKLVVRDKKTGADLLKEAREDKRFMALLEEKPAYPEGKIKAKDTAGSFAQGQLWVFESANDPVPFLKKHKVALEPNGNQFRLIDRATGEVRWSQNLPRTSVQWPGYNQPEGQATPLKFHGDGHVVVLNVGSAVYGLDPLGHRILWEKNLAGPTGPNNYVNLMLDPQDGTPAILYPDGYQQRIGQLGPVQAGYVCVLTRDGLVALDPTNGTTLWSRSDVPLRCRLYGDEQRVYVVEQGADGRAAGTRAFRAADGVSVPVPDFAPLLGGQAQWVDGRILLTETRNGKVVGGRRQPLVMRLYDVASGKNVWKKDFADGSVPLRPEGGTSLVGAVGPDGKVTVLDVRTGEEVFQAEVEAKYVESAAQGFLFEDGVQVYLALQGRLDAQAYPYGPPAGNFQPGSGVKSLALNGTVYAFERSGAFRWRADAENLAVALIPSDQPVLLLVSRYQKVLGPMGSQGVLQAGAVRIIDKRTGKFLYDQPAVTNMQPLQTVKGDLATGSLELLGFSQKITLTMEK
jgi:outer membrane protein assembly factor BamB/tetratricopeptide (TPR) repeat protein